MSVCVHTCTCLSTRHPPLHPPEERPPRSHMYGKFSLQVIGSNASSFRLYSCPELTLPRVVHIDEYIEGANLSSSNVAVVPREVAELREENLKVLGDLALLRELELKKNRLFEHALGRRQGVRLQ
eukprot:1340432-Prymnesium_polylepis.2